MAEKDVVALEYLEDNAHYADIINTCYFHGVQVIRPSDIKEKDRSEKISKKHSNGKNPISLQRDIKREVDVQMKTTIIAIENQSKIHYAMSLRVMILDALNYYTQWKDIDKRYQELRKKKKLEKTQTKKTADVSGEDITDENFIMEELGDLIKLNNAEFLSGFSKKDRLVPVVTIVLYFGEEEWDGPRCLKDILDLNGLPQEMIDGIANYPMHLIEVRNFEDYELFQTEWKWIFGFLQRDNDKEALMQYVKDNETAFRDLSEDTYDMISQFSCSGILKDYKDEFITEGGNLDMCKALDDMRQEAEARGIEIGESRGIEIGESRGIEIGESRGIEIGESRGIEIGESRGMIRGMICGIIRTYQELGASVEAAVNKIMVEYSLTESKAQEYIMEYWK